jgi:hypothetical protein
MAVNKNRKLNSGQVIIPAGHPNPPETHEVDAAWVLARHYSTVVEFLIPVDDYMRKTPDIVMLGVEWEIKSPKGNSRRNTIKDQFMNAHGKSHHLVIDGGRTPLDDVFILGKIHYELSNHRRIKKLLFITKERKVLEIK